MQQKQQYAKKERLQRFNQHVEELRASLKQDLAKKVPIPHRAQNIPSPSILHMVLNVAGCCAVPSSKQPLSRIMCTSIVLSYDARTGVWTLLLLMPVPQEA